MFRNIRWAATNDAPVCPNCGGGNAYECRRPNGALRFRCRNKECAKDFTITSGTLFASHKLPLRAYLAAIAIFCNEGQGQVGPGPLARPGRVLQGRLRAAAQAPRGHG